MSSYKVPQDVEADDKLIGPFSFRQFVYILIAAAAIGVAYVLFRILPPLVVIPLPIAIFFLVLALPLRKDQPMEVYLAAILSFHLKSRKRLWDPDGIESLVQIAAPRNSEPQRTKNVSVSEAEQRLRYLSNLSDSRGWSVRGVSAPQGSSMNPDIFNEAQQLPDTLDDNAAVSRNFDHMISQSNQRRHQEMLSQFQQSASTPAPVQPVATAPAQPVQQSQPAPAQSATTYQQSAPPVIPDPYAILNTTPEPEPVLDPYTPAPQYNPYPTSMSQSVIQPLSQQHTTPVQPAPPTPEPVAPEPEPSTSVTPVSPDIINLASNTDLSIETIAREAQRISQKEDEQKEVVISLR